MVGLVMARLMSDESRPGDRRSTAIDRLVKHAEILQALSKSAIERAHTALRHAEALIAEAEMLLDQSTIDGNRASEALRLAELIDSPKTVPRLVKFRA